MAKLKIPKRVGGVKLPKKVRKKAKKALKMAESPVVRDLAAAALGAAAQAKADRAIRNGSGGARVASLRATAKVDSKQIRDALRGAAIDGLRRFLDGFEEGLRNASPAGKRKPNSPTAPGAE